MLQRAHIDEDAIRIEEAPDSRAVSIAVAASLSFWLGIAGFLYADGYVGGDTVTAEAQISALQDG